MAPLFPSRRYRRPRLFIAVRTTSLLYLEQRFDGCGSESTIILSQFRFTVSIDGHDHCITDAQNPYYIPTWPLFLVQNCIFWTVYVLFRVHYSAFSASGSGIGLAHPKNLCSVCLDRHCYVQCHVCVRVQGGELGNLVGEKFRGMVLSRHL